jgi:hypothetical protein
METQSILFDNKESIPDGLYLQLMNALKNDFSSNRQEINTNQEVHRLRLQDILNKAKIDQMTEQMNVLKNVAKEFAKGVVELESEMASLKGQLEKEKIEKTMLELSIGLN